MTTMELIEKYGIGFNCLSDAYDLGVEQGREDRKDKDIDDLQHILLKNVNDHEQALIEIIYWINEQIGEKND